MKIINGTDVQEVEGKVTAEELKGREVISINTCEFNEGSKIMITVALSGVSYDLDYNANGGTGTIKSQGGTELIVKNAKELTAPSGKLFSKWNTKAIGDGDDYAAGDVIEISKDTILYAIWEDIEG